MSSQKILDAIMQDAQRESEELLQNAASMAEESRNQALAAAGERENRQREDLKRECAEISSRAKQNALLAARKNTLAAKRGIIDRVFDSALSELCSLNGEQYRALVCRLVCESAETGREQLLVPKSDRDKYKKPYIGGKTMLELLNEEFKGARGIKGEFSMASGDCDFKGGVKLIGENADIDCSFDTLLAQWREENEARACEMLFGKEG